MTSLLISMCFFSLFQELFVFFLLHYMIDRCIANYLNVLSWIWYLEVIRKDNASWNLWPNRLLLLYCSCIIVNSWHDFRNCLWSAAILHDAHIHCGLSLHCSSCGSLCLCRHRLKHRAKQLVRIKEDNIL